MLPVVGGHQLLDRRHHTKGFANRREQLRPRREPTFVVSNQPLDRIRAKPCTLDPPPGPGREGPVPIDQRVVQVEAGEPRVHGSIIADPFTGWASGRLLNSGPLAHVRCGDRSSGEDATGINAAESPGRALLGRARAATHSECDRTRPAGTAPRMEGTNA
jgi:hypothetical protein